jgi:hypothetical protein
LLSNEHRQNGKSKDQEKNDSVDVSTPASRPLVSVELSLQWLDDVLP